MVDPEPEKPPKSQQSSSVNSKPDIPKVSMDDFKILKVLGKGAYGKVFQVRKVRGPGGGGTVYAMKAMDKSRICGSRTDVRHTKAERDVLVSVEHPFIVKLKFAFETPKVNSFFQPIASVKIKRFLILVMVTAILSKITKVL